MSSQVRTGSQDKSGLAVKTGQVNLEHVKAGVGQVWKGQIKLIQVKSSWESLSRTGPIGNIHWTQNLFWNQNLLGKIFFHKQLF